MAKLKFSVEDFDLSLHPFVCSLIRVFVMKEFLQAPTRRVGKS